MAIVRPPLGKHTVEGARLGAPKNEVQPYLVVYLLCSASQRNVLLEDIARLGELLALGPVVECASDKDLLGRMLPTKTAVSGGTGGGERCYRYRVTAPQLRKRAGPQSTGSAVACW